MLGGRIVGEGKVILGPSEEENGNLMGRRKYEYASVRSRWLAGLVDWAVALVWGAATWVVIWGPSLLWNYPFGEHFLADLVYYFGTLIVNGVLILRFMFNAISISSVGDTFGHRLFKLQVLDTGANRIGLMRALARQCLGSPLLFVSSIPGFVWSLMTGFTGHLDLTNGPVREFLETVDDSWLLFSNWGPFGALALTIANHAVMAIDRNGRGVHDSLVRTMVIKAPEKDRNGFAA